MKKGFLIGLIIGLITASFPVFAAQMYFDNINITVNGQKVKGHNILFNDRTYVPLREIAEMLNKQVIWDGKTNTAHIDDIPDPDGYPY